MLTENLNKNQSKAVNYGDGPLLVAAGAGSGKTRVLTSRLIKLLRAGVSPTKILAITFTNKAAKEMRNRVFSSLQSPASSLQISTFHSFGARILRKEAKHWGRSAGFTIYDDKDSLSLLKKVIKNLNLSKDKQKLSGFDYHISKAKSQMINIDDELTKTIFNDYEKALRQNNAFDFDDLIEKPVRLFQEKPEILAKYQRRYQYVLVDEFQDTNTAQYLLIKLLAQKHRNLSVVGDDAQSIYGWRHADFRNILNFEKDWPNVQIILLEENYRSTANVIGAANQLIKHNQLQRPKDLWTKNPPGEKIHIIASTAEDEEADQIVSKINEDAETAILYRTNAQSRAIEQALLQYQIAYRIFGGVKFYERKEIKDMMAGLRLAANPQDGVSLDRIQKNFSKKKGGYLIEELPRLAQKLTPVELINFIINNTNYVDYLERNFRNADERWENIKELINFAASAESLDELLEQASLVQAQDNEKGATSSHVNLMTIHMAKGLEFNTVFVAGCTETILPHQRSLSTKEELEEERRLMYVAMTRARQRLFLTFHNLPSRFLYELPPELIENELPDEDERYIEYE